MAARWMQAKIAKLKRDGMADTRGPYKPFKDKPSAFNPRPVTAAGWYVTGNDKRTTCGTYRGAVRKMGPFATKADALRFARGMFHGDTVKAFQL